MVAPLQVSHLAATFSRDGRGCDPDDGFAVTPADSAETTLNNEQNVRLTINGRNMPSISTLVRRCLMRCASILR